MNNFLVRLLELKNTLMGNFQKLGINTYTGTWNFGMYDTSSER